MGFNPHRKFQARPTDYIVLSVGLLVTAALVVWAVL